MQTDDFDVGAVIARARSGERLKFVFFWGHTESEVGRTGPWVFSQWYPSPFVVDGQSYATAEHFMMAQKAALFGDAAIRDEILQSSDPGKVKALGRRIRRFDNVVWNREREAIVTRGSLEKFRQNPTLQEYMMMTGDKILVEASPKDTIWGIGLAQDDPAAQDPAQWKGMNLLGFCLMRARAALNVTRPPSLAPGRGPGGA